MVNKDKLIQSEITVLELINSATTFFKFLLKNWYWYLIAIVFGIGFVLYRMNAFESNYTAATTFVIESQDNGSGLSGGVLSQLGLGGGSGINNNRVIKVAQSKSTLRNVLARPVILGQDTVAMIDFVLDSSRLTLCMEESERLKSIHIDSVQQITDASDREINLLVDFIHLYFNSENQPFLLVNYDESAEFFEISVQSQNELLSYELAIAYFQEVEKFYTDKLNSNQVSYYYSLKTRVDSVYSDLQNTQYRLLRIKDKSKEIFLQTDRSGELRLQQEVQQLSGTYSELFRNLNQAELSLRILQPVVAVIDQPVMPLGKSEFNPIKQTILHVGGFTFLLTIIFLTLFLWRIMISTTLKQS